MSEFLVFFETSGNQSYVYATNKLKESIGASELTYRAGTKWVLEAVGFSDVPTDTPPKFREWLKKGPKFEGIEVIISTSGKSLLIVPERKAAEKIVQKVSHRAAKEAPGLSICGAIVELASRSDISQAIKKAHDRFNKNRDLMPVPQQRFGMIPFCVPCSTSGLPAESSGDGIVKEKAFSLAAKTKRGMSENWFERIKKIFNEENQSLHICTSADELDKKFDKLSWLGVVFSDGNGLGQIMMKFDQWINGGDYISSLRDFSIALDEATEASFLAACRVLVKNKAVEHGKLPVVPLLLGGDDLTVMIDGKLALSFTEAFLNAFETESSKQEAIADIAQKALNAPRLSAGAGVAIVKAHFPYYGAHSLAESLLKSAKKTKKHVVQRGSSDKPFPCSSLDFHILYDTAFTSLDEMREERRTAAGKEHLWGGPYVTTPLEELADAGDKSWAERHQIGYLMASVKALRAKDEDGKYCLPNSQMHMLREALAHGRPFADVRLAELSRLKDSGLDKLFGEKDSLFFQDGNEVATRFLDALSSAEFWCEEMKS